MRDRRNQAAYVDEFGAFGSPTKAKSPVAVDDFR